jgi:hypothetical protein
LFKAIRRLWKKDISLWKKRDEKEKIVWLLIKVVESGGNMKIREEEKWVLNEEDMWDFKQRYVANACKNLQECNNCIM